MRGGVLEFDIELVDLSRGVFKGVLINILLFLKFFLVGIVILCLFVYFFCSVIELLYEVCIEGFGFVRGLYFIERLIGFEFLNRFGDIVFLIFGVFVICENIELFCDICLVGNLVIIYLGLLCKLELDFVVFGRDFFFAFILLFVFFNGVEIFVLFVLVGFVIFGFFLDVFKFFVLLKLVVFFFFILVFNFCCWELV